MRNTNKVSKFEAWAKAKYKPVEAPWKRPVLLFISIILLISVSIAAYTQTINHWTNDGIWIVIGPFGFVSLLGLYVSIKCKHFWVALLLGGF